MENLAEILNHKGKNFLLKELKPELKKISLLESKVIDARVDGWSFSTLEGDDLKITTDQIVLRCSAIIGCELPFTDLFANVLSDQIISFINGFGFGDLTLNEITLAMEINLAQGLPVTGGVELEEVVFTGRCVNVAFLAKVLKNYMAFRKHVDRKIQNQIDGYAI